MNKTELERKPKIAVLLAAYNGIQWIQEQIVTIINQEDILIHIFISVDLSNDNTYEWCRYLESSHPNITVLSYGERFGGAAANFFRLIKEVDFSCFDYVSLADQDDIWFEDKLSRAIHTIKISKSDAYSSNVLAFWPDGREKLIIKSQQQKQFDYLFEAAGPGCTYVMKVGPLLKFKQLLSNNPDQIKRVALHDWLIYAFFRSKNYKWLIDTQYKMLYRQHASNQVGTNTGLIAALKRIKLVKNGWYKEQVVFISNLVNDSAIEVHSRWMLLRNITKLRRCFKEQVLLFVFVLFKW